MSSYPTFSKLEERITSDILYFSPCLSWNPHTDWDELVTIATYVIWLFIWDDEIDDGDTNASQDEELAQAYYKRSISYIRQELGLTNNTVGVLVAPGTNMALFADVGKVLRIATSQSLRNRFYIELDNYMVNVCLEHGQRLQGNVPTLKEYLEIRLGSIGSSPHITLARYFPLCS